MAMEHITAVEKTLFEKIETSHSSLGEQIRQEKSLSKDIEAGIISLVKEAIEEVTAQ